MLPATASAVPREVHGHGVAFHGDGGPDGDVLVGDAVALHEVLGRVLAVGEFADGLAGPLLGVGDDLLEGGEDGFLAAAVHQLADALLGDVVGGDLGPQVPAPDVRGADVGQQEVQHVLDVLPAAHQAHGRDDDALLEDLARVGGHGAGTHPAHVGVVGPRDGVADDLTLRGRRARRGLCPAGGCRPSTGR